MTKYPDHYLKDYDPVCRVIAAHMFTSLTQECVPNDNEYGPDMLLISNGNVEGFVEVESSGPQAFSNGTYYTGIDKITVPERRERTLSWLNTWWMKFDSNLANYIVMTGSFILSHPLKSLPKAPWNSGNKNELFFQIPYDSKYIKAIPLAILQMDLKAEIGIKSGYSVAPIE